jgi:hypothetical protein
MHKIDLRQYFPVQFIFQTCGFCHFFCQCLEKEAAKVARLENISQLHLRIALAGGLKEGDAL